MFFTLSWTSFAQEDSRMFVAPGRETFFNFPSETIGNQYTLTVFLPTEVAPISHHYPVVYFIGLDRSDRNAFQNFARENKVFLVGLSIPEQEFTELQEKLPAFIEQELVPYIDTNYSTVADPSARVLAVRGELAAAIALDIVKRGGFGSLSLQSPGNALTKMKTNIFARTFVMGTQEELAVASRAFEQVGARYGIDYALDYLPLESGWLTALNSTYFSASAASLGVKKVLIKTGVKELPSLPGKSVSLQVYTILENGLKTVYIPQIVHTSPPYLDWKPELGMLRVRAGAEPGSIKIGIDVDNVGKFSKIMLKKQEKWQ